MSQSGARAGSRVNDKAIRKEASRIFEKVVAVKVFLESIDLALIEDLLHRAQESPLPDGYPSRSGGGGSASSEEWTPAERAALSGLPGDKEDDQRPDFEWVEGEEGPEKVWNLRRHTDPIGDAVSAAMADLIEGSTTVLAAERKMAVVIHAADGFRVRPIAGGFCQRCGDPTGPPDYRLIRGLDKKCYSAWYRLSKPRPSVRDWIQREVAREKLETEIGEQVVGGLYADEMGEIDRLRERGELPPTREGA